MTPRMLSLSIGAFVLGVTIPVAIALAPPAWIDEEFRLCMGETIDIEMSLKIGALREYHDDQIRDLEQYRDDLRRAWAITNEDVRKDDIRNADRRFRDATRETKREYDARIREIRDQSRDAQRECRTRVNDHKRFVRNICINTSDCRGNQVCTTERGVCDSSCPPDAESCVQACAGTCERRTSSSNSSSRTVGSHPWDNYQSNGQICRSTQECSGNTFCSTGLGECNSPCAPGTTCIQVCEGRCLYPSSASSSSSSSSSSQSSTSQGGACQAYRCPDGREFPACTPQGNPVDYFQNPCYT